jgi:hypothetical protein
MPKLLMPRVSKGGGGEGGGGNGGGEGGGGDGDEGGRCGGDGAALSSELDVKAGTAPAVAAVATSASRNRTRAMPSARRQGAPPARGATCAVRERLLQAGAHGLTRGAARGVGPEGSL